MNLVHGLLQAYIAAFLVGIGGGVLLKMVVNLVRWATGDES